MKVGIVGLGFMGAVHLNAFKKIPDISVAAICTSSAAALSGDLRSIGGNLGRDLGIHDFSQVQKYREWAQLVEDPDLDVIDICLPSDLHTSVALAALAAGKHVFCEKPMALTLADCDRMITAARQRKRILMVAQVLRFWPEYAALDDFVKSGSQGAILSATFIRQCGLPDWSRWLPNANRSGGAVIDLLIHDIDQALSLFGMPQKVAAKPHGNVDGVTATLMYDHGPEVRIQGGWFAPTTPFSMSFQVRAERAELDFSSRGLLLNDAQGRQTKLNVSDQDGYETETAYFIECCRKGLQPERCLPEDSARALQIAIAIKQSRAAGGGQISC